MRFFFTHIPPELDTEVEDEIQAQGNATLHAFLINCCGIFDNMAWFIAHRNALDQEMDLEASKRDIGLFKARFRRHLPSNTLVKVQEFEEWHRFLTDNRDPTAHRIPPYIIPALVSDAGDASYTPHYIHSFDSPMVPLHPQVIVDVGAVLETIDAIMADIEATGA